MKKRLTLNYVWAECIKMYTYIVKKKATGSTKTVSRLKALWVTRHGYKGYELAENCFFCEYSQRHQIPLKHICTMCPAKLVDSVFQCCKIKYEWSKYPDLFLKEILRLDAIRRAK